MMKFETLIICVMLICGGFYPSPGTAQQPPSQPSFSQLADALSNGWIKALIRYNGQYRNSNLHLLQDSSTPEAPAETVQQYSAIGGYIGYETAPWFNTSVGATVYGAAPLGNNPPDRRGLGGLYEADGGQDSYAVLGEIFVRVQKAGHLLKIGRQELPDYRFISLSNIRFTPITHNGVIYENRSLENFGFNLAYISKMKQRNANKFVGMARGARLRESSSGKQLIRGEYNPDDYDSSGYAGTDKQMSMAAVTYNNDNVSLEGWNYYISDFVNTVYLYGQYKLKPRGDDFQVALSAQFTRQWDVGNHIAGRIDTWHYGLSASLIGEGWSLFGSFNQVGYNENSYDGGTIFVRWGTPQMFNSFQVQDSELAGTKSAGAGLQYDFGLNGMIPRTVMRWRYGNYDMPDKLWMTDARQDRREATFDLRYAFSKASGFGIFTRLNGLSLQFRLAFNNYRTDYDFEAYKLIHGYDFESVTKNFIDTRLYLDYVF